MTFSLDFRAHSEIGLVRKNNQDSAYASPTMLVVADGMGGAAAGDLASSVAITEIRKADGRFEREGMLSAFAGAVHRANDRIADLVASDPELEGTGTTVSGALFSGTELGIAHIGDSRGYLLRDGRLHRITHDHSWVQSLIDAGRLDEEEAAFHPHRSLLLKVLNGQPLHNPDLKLLDVQLGDRYLFCSDGLSGFTTDHMIGDILHDPSLDEALASLVAAAHRGGAGDNITIVLADVVEQSDELDARPGESFGAVLTTRIPDAALASSADGTSASPAGTTSPGEAATSGGSVGQDPERLRYAPGIARKRHRLARIVLPAIVLLIFGTLAGSLYAYGRTQYFVADNGGTIGIYQGVPGDVMGLALHTLVESDATLVADLPTYYRAQVQTGLRVDSLGDARATLAELTLKAEACIAKRAGTPPVSTPASTPASTPGASVSGSATPQSSGSPSPGSSGSAAPGSASSSSTPASSSTPSSSSTSVPLDEECG